MGFKFINTAPDPQFFFQVRDQISEVDFTLPNTKTFLLILPQVQFPANSFPTNVPQRGDEVFVEKQKGDSHGLL